MPGEKQPEPAMEYRRFGKTEEMISVITLGGMRFPQGWNPPREHLPAKSIGNAVATVRQALDVGINHFETAYGYIKSEHLFGAALAEVKVPRRRFKMMTKGAPETAGETRRMVENQLRALGLDYVDFYAWHGINNEERLRMALQKKGPVETLFRLREEGLIRHIGFSTHAPLDIILKTLDSGLFSFMNLHYYYFFQHNLPAVQRAGAEDIGVFIISPNEKGGMLWHPPEKLKQLCDPLTAVQFNGRFCLSHPQVHTLSMGMHAPEHFTQNLKILNGTDYLSETGRLVLSRMDRQMAAIPSRCTLCQECLPCPEDINIPEILRFRNLLQGFNMEEYGRFRYNMLDSKGHWFPGHFGSRCTHCGDCLPRCPEHLDIPQLLNETHKKLFDRKAWIKTRLWTMAALMFRIFKKLLLR